MKRNCILLGILLLLASGAFADERKESQTEQIASSFYELRDHAVLRVGDKIFLTHAEGDVIHGKIESVSWDDATLTLESPFQDRESELGGLTFAEADIRRIEVEISDSLANGALIGAAVGAGLILVPYAFAEGEPIGGDGAYFFGAAIVAGAGAGIGAGIDALIKKRRLVFDAPERESSWNLRAVPILTKHRKGIAVSLSF